MKRFIIEVIDRFESTDTQVTGTLWMLRVTVGQTAGLRVGVRAPQRVSGLAPHPPLLQFALVQFSSSFRVHFDFNTFKRTSNVETLVWDVMQLQGGTYTASAIRKVV